MNNENSSNELFPESSSAPEGDAPVKDAPVTGEKPSPDSSGSSFSAPASEKSSGKVITEDSVIEESEIPDIDAGGARSCGEFLKLQREKLNLSYADVFEATRIKEDMIRALEEEDFSQLPQPVYVIAYVKRLCHFYNINNVLAREFLDRLRAEISFDVPDDVSKSVKGSDESEENMRRIRNLAFAVGLVIFLLLILIISGITMVVLNLRQAGHQLETRSPFNENTLVELQGEPKLKITEL
ncbi:MAG: helix-turn-helix domain-containing protein [Lentisphaeria bacterium]|nr:helix-turn-helix domain-containing protein [Lentisphaeria bacterium]